MTWAKRHVPGWIKEHGPTIVVAMLLFFVTSTAIPQLRRGDAACTAVNRVVTYVDNIVEYSTRTADRPQVKVTDPAVQKLIDQGRQQSEDFRAYAQAQSKRARCRP